MQIIYKFDKGVTPSIKTKVKLGRNGKVKPFSKPPKFYTELIVSPTLYKEVMANEHHPLRQYFKLK